MSRRVRRRTSLRDFRGVLRPTGAVLAGVAAGQLLCGLVGVALELSTRPAEVRDLTSSFTLLGAAGLTAVGGASLFGYGRRFKAGTLSRREAVLAVGMIWLGAGVFGAVPFVLDAGLSPVDALFEAISGLTTTGATIVTQIEGTVPKGAGAGAYPEGGLSRPLLLWRSLIQWLGGMGIVVLFVAVFPSVGAGAKHMFKGEVPGTTAEGLTPRIAETSFSLWRLYAAFTLLEVVLLVLLRMDPFEAVCHAFTTMSTGGFSTRDASIGAFESPAIEYVIASFMILGSVNYGLYYALLRGRSVWSVLRNEELRVFLAMVALFTLALTAGTFLLHHRDLLEAFRYAYFMVGTTLSSTGYGTDDYMAYPEPILFLVIVMMFVGGCSGSTAGGIKVERVVLLSKMSWTEFRSSFRPSVVQLVRMGRSVVPDDVLTDVAVFFSVYMACLGLGLLFVTTVDQVGLATAFGATLSCLSNMGPAPFYVGSDNFAAYSDLSKGFFVLAMLLGRLEFFTLFALLVPDFWRR
ncbi:MAG: TrkH family potassium uptake protein [Sandaracinaceae bacterium]